MKELAIMLMLIAALLAGGIFLAPVQAAPSNAPDVECYPWADAEGWTITRCEDWNNNESCLIASSGFVACRMGD